MNKIQVYHVIYHTVKNNKGITLNQLSGLVSTALELEFEVVKAAEVKGSEWLDSELKRHSHSNVSIVLSFAVDPSQGL